MLTVWVLQLTKLFIKEKTFVAVGDKNRLLIKKNKKTIHLGLQFKFLKIVYSVFRFLCLLAQRLCIFWIT